MRRVNTLNPGPGYEPGDGGLISYEGGGYHHPDLAVTGDYVNLLKRVEVNDSDYVISTTDSITIAITALTTNRTMYLPPATKKGQLIQLVDESGQCAVTRSIFTTPNGTDTIEAYTVGRRVNFPYANVTLQSNGAGKWVVAATNRVPLSAGVVEAPSFTNNLDGSITLGAGLYSLFADSLGRGRAKGYPIAGGTFVLTNSTNNYVVVNYNNGAPVVQVITNVTLINETTIIPIYTIYREGTTLHIANWDTLGDALANKIHKSIVKTQRFRHETGLALGEVATRAVTISAGTIYQGAVPVDMPAIDSNGTGGGYMRLIYHVAGAWTIGPAITQYNNTQYDDGTNLQTLTNNRYAVNFVYRSVGADNDFYIVLGQGDYQLGAAQVAQPPVVPSIISSHAVLVGFIIVQKNATSATEINTAFITTFSAAGVTDHESLANLQGGAAGEHSHLTTAEYTGTGTGVFVRKDSAALTGTPTAPTPAVGDNSTLIATTAYVKGQNYLTGNQTITLSGDVTGSGSTSITATLSTNQAGAHTWSAVQTISNTTAATSTSTGALIVAGGAGFGGAVYASSITANTGNFTGASGLTVNSSSYPTSYPTTLGVGATADGKLQLGNNANNEIVFGSTATGGYGRFWVNNTAAAGSAPNGILALTLDAAGNATFTKAIAIGNTVSASSTNTVTNKVLINIGGTNYYLLASTSGA